MKIKKVRSNKVIILLFYVIISYFGIIIPFMTDASYKVLALSLMIELILFVISVRIITGKIITFITIFAITLFVFHFGQVIILGLFEKMSTQNDLRIVLKYFPDNISISAIRIMNIAFVSLLLGALFATKNYNKEKNFNEEINNANKNNKIILITSLVIILLTIPVKIFLDVSLLYKSFSVSFSYASMWLQGVPNFIRIYANFIFIGIALLIPALKYKPKKQTLVFSATVLYLIILMLSGWRSENVSYLVIIYFIYITSRNNKISIYKIIITFLFTYSILSILYTVVYLRYMNYRGLELYVNTFLSVFIGEKNVILESLREYGNTGYTTICVLKKWLPNYNPSYGKSYILGMFSTLPNITGVPGKLSEISVYPLYLQKYGALTSGYINIGGSILGEFFFNFGIPGGVIFANIIGILLGEISTNVDKNFNLNKLYKQIYYIPILFSTLYWIRDVFSRGIREVVWGIIFTKLIIYILRKMVFDNENIICN